MSIPTKVLRRAIWNECEDGREAEFFDRVASGFEM